MEHKIKFELKNYKLFKDYKVEFGDEGYLYLIKGGKNKGKTTVLQAIMSLMAINNNVPEAITRGEHQASVQGEIPSANGKYFVNMNVTKSGTSFSMFDEKGMKISRIKDMRDVFAYNSMTVEDFIKKSYSSAGRREQIKILSTLLNVFTESFLYILIIS